MSNLVPKVKGEQLCQSTGLKVIRKEKPLADRKKAVEFESHPPSCGSCVWFMGRVKRTEKTPFRDNYCIINKFYIQRTGSLCNLWESKKGETIE